jgi:hypothetical protein
MLLVIINFKMLELNLLTIIKVLLIISFICYMYEKLNNNNLVGSKPYVSKQLIK